VATVPSKLDKRFRVTKKSLNFVDQCNWRTEKKVELTTENVPSPKPSTSTSTSSQPSTSISHGTLYPTSTNHSNLNRGDVEVNVRDATSTSFQHS
jgi:hypothetical protein